MKYPGKLSNPRGKGLFAAVDLANAEMRNKSISKIFEKKVILLGCGERSIRFRPAMTITKSQIDEGLDVIESVVKEL